MKYAILFTLLIVAAAAGSKPSNPWVKIRNQGSTLYVRKDSIVSVESNSPRLEEFNGKCTLTVFGGGTYHSREHTAAELIQHINQY